MFKFSGLILIACVAMVGCWENNKSLLRAVENHECTVDVVNVPSTDHAVVVVDTTCARKAANRYEANNPSSAFDSGYDPMDDNTATPQPKRLDITRFVSHTKSRLNRYANQRIVLTDAEVSNKNRAWSTAYVQLFTDRGIKVYIFFPIRSDIDYYVRWGRYNFDVLVTRVAWETDRATGMRHIEVHATYQR